MLARSTIGSGNFNGHIDDYVRPVTYTCRSLDEVRLHSGNTNSSGGAVITSQDDCCVLDSLTSNHFSSGEESNLKRRQSSEDFLEMQAARHNNAVSAAGMCTVCDL